ncbi:protein LKAAEAR1 isoform X2 [Pantherophis guttatus]|uniref:Protein LKAAEAR1 isoform X1 n=1 Tax=Pantherophis guttatus TaxID=94885 RepID=A0ABM3YW08_PANGU|nr:protein LKAAEAR1 isoform X1 [Pantherophis guttatus]XP_060540309.1 protein LKAAEAR1 isoform X2 [Pantherophis guttatus]XP_060540310.1 protein LKAAEAR1 isoform X2 [Pantherophis guttatus]XP_060540311.1 protein LKAAEAR1 isoform X2 [Pantherophis guttatus]
MTDAKTLLRNKPTQRFRKSSPSCDVSKLTPEQKARYLAFADPTKPDVKTMLATALMKERKVLDNRQRELDDKNLIGVLKASEARNRLRNARLQYQNLRAQEINFLISFQRNAKGAVRLEVFLPPRRNIAKLSDCMNTIQRSRIEEILEDESGFDVQSKHNPDI